MSAARDAIRQVLVRAVMPASEYMDASVALDTLEAELVSLRERLDQAEAEIDRRDGVLEWLRENMPRALELCPYKLCRSEATGAVAAVEPARREVTSGTSLSSDASHLPPEGGPV